MSDAFCNRGNAYLQIGKSRKALEDYNKAIELNGDDPDLYHNRAFINQALGLTKEADADFAKAKELRDKVEK